MAQGLGSKVNTAGQARPQSRSVAVYFRARALHATKLRQGTDGSAMRSA